MSIRIGETFPRLGEVEQRGPMVRLPWDRIPILKSSFAKLDSEFEQRIVDNSAGHFSRRFYVLLASALIGASIFLLSTLLTPPEDIAQTINRQVDQFQKVPNGRIVFNEARDPEQISKANGHEITLPFRNIAELAGFRRDSIWYHFNINIPQEKFRPATFAVLVPKIWGHSEVYSGKQLVDFGKDIRPIIPITSPSTSLLIRADLTGTERVVPISATYPLVVAEVDSLRRLSSDVDLQIQPYYRSLALYMLTVVIFGMLFVAYPRKPELLAFIVFLSCSLMFSAYSGLFEKNIVALGNWHAQQVIGLLFDFIVNLSLLGFSILFLRSHPKSTGKAIANVALITLMIGLALAWFVFRHSDAIYYRQVGHLVLNSMFLAFQLFYVCPRLAHLWSNANAPLARKATCSLVIAAILLVYVANIRDFLFLTEAMVTQYRNALLLNLFLSITVAFEISRAEINQAIFGSMLPREVREGINIKKSTVDRRGFIILLDAMGYAAQRDKFSASLERALFVEELAEQMLRPIADMNLSNVSILNSTGDGIYCAVRGDLSRENFETALSISTKIANQTLTSSGTEIKFRAAFGYGDYTVRMIEVGNLRKEFTAGNVLNDLSRIIGNSKEVGSVRLLWNEGISQVAGNLDVDLVIDKHGFTHHYVEMGKRQKAA